MTIHTFILRKFFKSNPKIHIWTCASNELHHSQMKVESPNLHLDELLLNGNLKISLFDQYDWHLLLKWIVCKGRISYCRYLLYKMFTITKLLLHGPSELLLCYKNMYFTLRSPMYISYDCTKICPHFSLVRSPLCFLFGRSDHSFVLPTLILFVEEEWKCDPHFMCIFFFLFAD